MAYDELNPRDAYQLTSNGAPYIDVRTPAEFAEGHPEGAVNIPIFFMGPGGMQPNPEFLNVVKKHFDPADALVVGCRSGGRSARACELLARHGWEGRLVNVAGGFHGGGVPGWKAEGLPSTMETEGRTYDDLR
jgi:rhodanese-related sulfurtransferase